MERRGFNQFYPDADVLPHDVPSRNHPLTPSRPTNYAPLQNSMPVSYGPAMYHPEATTFNYAPWTNATFPNNQPNWTPTQPKLFTSQPVPPHFHQSAKTSDATWNHSFGKTLPSQAAYQQHYQTKMPMSSNSCTFPIGLSSSFTHDVKELSEFEKNVQIVLSRNSALVSGHSKKTFGHGSDDCYSVPITVFDSMVREHRDLARKYRRAQKENTFLQQVKTVNPRKRLYDTDSDDKEEHDIPIKRQSASAVANKYFKKPTLVQFADDEILPPEAKVYYECLAVPNEESEVLKHLPKEVTHDLSTLTGRRWLNDGVINSYLHLIQSRSEETAGIPKVYLFSSFFKQSLALRGHKHTKTWTNNTNIFEKDVLLFPSLINENHWVLAAVFVKQKAVRIFNSLLHCDWNPYVDFDWIITFLVDEWNRKHKEEDRCQKEDWSLEVPTMIPKQHNEYDCGVFVCQYAERLSRFAQIDFTQEKTPHFRRKMIYELVEKVLLTPV